MTRKKLTEDPPSSESKNTSSSISAKRENKRKDCDVANHMEETVQLHTILLHGPVLGHRLSEEFQLAHWRSYQKCYIKITSVPDMYVWHEH